MPDYFDSKIYKLCSSNTDDIYIGSTTSPLSTRIAGHRRDFKNNSKYVSSCELMKYSDVKIILMERFPCNNRSELELRERWFIQHTKCVNRNHIKTDECNRLKHNNDSLKWYHQNKEKVKKYRMDNSDSIKCKEQRYYNQNKEYKANCNHYRRHTGHYYLFYDLFEQ